MAKSKRVVEAEVVEATDEPVETKPLSAWRAEVVFPVTIRVPVDIAIVIGVRTITFHSAEQEIPELLLAWLKRNPEHRNKFI